MNRKIVLVIIGCVGLLWAVNCSKSLGKGFYNKGVNIIPKPNQMTVKKGEVFQVNPETCLSLKPQSDKLKKLAAYFNGKISRALGHELQIKNGQKANCVVFEINGDMALNPEDYQIEVDPSVVTVTAKTEQGIFYGIQSLLQLLPAEVLSENKVMDVDWIIPGISIKDEPRYRWRGMHLDVCRHFYPVEFVKKCIDMMALYKMNTFHWHLTEDQGWRIEIKKYPLLTEIGSKRIEGDGMVYGGYYTQEEVKEVVQYAADRFINVVPEIEMPGHALAALTAYPQYSCTGGPFKVRNVWGVEPHVYCAGKDETFTFLKDIISEVVELFPGPYFHIGGDECPKDQWKLCPDCQKRIKKEGLADEHELQSYFIRAIEKVLIEKNKKLIGWDEILEGGLAPEATVMSWRGIKGAIESAKQGHDAVMSPTSHCYLDYYQGDPYAEPLNIGGYLPLKKVYSLEVTPKELNKEEQKHILGAQGNIWTEYMPDSKLVEYMAFPRIMALAEVVWTAKPNHSWEGFLQRLNNHHVRLDHLQVNFHIPLPEGPFDRLVFTGKIKISFEVSRPGIKMVYTLDGSDPNSHSKVYKKPIRIKKSLTLKIRSLLPTGQMSKIRTISVVKETHREPVAHQSVTPGLKYRLTKGNFLKVDELKQKEEWQTGVLSELNYDFKAEGPCALIAEGFIDIKDDDIYTFYAHVSQLFIDDQLLIDSQGKSKRLLFPAMIALKKGKHKLKIVFLNNIEKGVDSSWYNLELQIKGNNNKEPRKIEAGELSH